MPPSQFLPQQQQPQSPSAVPNNYADFGTTGPLRLVTQGSRDQQVRDYINQTLGDYSNLQPYAGTNADMSGQGRQTQLSALGSLGGLTGNGRDPQARESQRQATNLANESAQGQMGSTLLNAQMGGTNTGPGSSANLAAQAAQSQGQAQAANTAGRQGQAAALARRLQALGAYGSLAGAIRSGDVNSNEQGFQNQLQQLGGQSAARNSLANYYTNQLNASAAQNAANWQAALGAGGMALGGFGMMRGMGNGYGASSSTYNLPGDNGWRYGGGLGGGEYT